MIRNLRLLEKRLERIYLSILVTIFLLIVFTPYLFRAGFTIFEEEFIEVAAIILLFIVGYVVLRLYRKEVARNLAKLNRVVQEKDILENRLTEAFKYIGSVNIQVREIESVFSEINKFPENKKDFGHILYFLAAKVLGMVNVDWALFRIIDTRNLDTLIEHIETRGNAVFSEKKISNKILVSNERSDRFTFVGAAQQNASIKAFCVFPKTELPKDSQVFIRAVVNQLEMLFLISTSTFYRGSHPS